MLIGDFTPKLAQENDSDPDTFTLCGEEFEVLPAVGAGSFLAYTAAMKTAADDNERGESQRRRAVTVEGRARAERTIVEADMGAAAAVHALLGAVLGEDQLPRFLKTVDRYGITIIQLVDLIQQIEGAISGRPTKSSSASSDGRSTTGLDSTAAGSGPTETPLVMSPRDQQVALIEGAPETSLNGTASRHSA